MASVWVIDDSSPMRKILRRYLRELGFERVEDAPDGRQALDRLRQASEAPDAVLVDWNMPVMSGLEFVRAARQEARLRGTRLVMVTTQVELANVAQALEAGADEYIMKPFTSEALADKLRLLDVVP